jgi:hypothetical protein
MNPLGEVAISTSTKQNSLAILLLPHYISYLVSRTMWSYTMLYLSTIDVIFTKIKLFMSYNVHTHKYEIYSK